MFPPNSWTFIVHNIIMPFIKCITFYSSFEVIEKLKKKMRTLTFKEMYFDPHFYNIQIFTKWFIAINECNHECLLCISHHWETICFTQYHIISPHLEDTRSRDVNNFSLLAGNWQRQYSNLSLSNSKWLCFFHRTLLSP